MLEELLGARNFDIVPHLAVLVTAYLLALPIGWNREKEERSAGLRTFPLVAVATCGFVQAAQSAAITDPEPLARIMEGIIAGMGFIGGGAILRKEDSVKGTATAASIWVTGAIGAAVGLGAIDVAIMLSLATLVTLLVMRPLKKLTGSEDADEDEESAPKSS